MLEFYTRERNDLNHEGKTSLTYEVRSKGTCDLSRLAYYVHKRYRAISEGELEGIAEDFLTEMINMLADGYSVSLGRLGNFSVKIGLRPDATANESSRHNSRSLCVKGLKFKTTKGFIRDLNQKCNIVSEGGGVQHLHRSPYTLEERIQRAVAFLEEKHIMRIYDYAYLNKLSRTAASKELRTLDRNPSVPIVSKGSGPSKCFVLK